MNFRNDNEAIAHLQNESKHYSLMTSQQEMMPLLLGIRDIAEELKQHNDFIAKHKKSFGYEPNIFD